MCWSREKQRLQQRSDMHFLVCHHIYFSITISWTWCTQISFTRSISNLEEIKGYNSSICICSECSICIAICSWTVIIVKNKNETEQLDGKPKLITEVVMHINASMEDWSVILRKHIQLCTNQERILHKLKYTSWFRLDLDKICSCFCQN